MRFFAIFALLFTSAAWAESHIRTADIEEICYAKTIGYKHLTQSEKNSIFQRDGVPGGNHTGKCAVVEGCEVDHRVSLELGGNNDPSNLMIQAYDGPCNAHQKNTLEEKFHTLVCSHQLAIQDAQRMLYEDWIAAYKHYIDNDGCSAK